VQEVNIQNMNVELVAQMFKNYQSNVLFHLEGMMVTLLLSLMERILTTLQLRATSETLYDALCKDVEHRND